MWKSLLNSLVRPPGDRERGDGTRKGYAGYVIPTHSLKGPRNFDVVMTGHRSRAFERTHGG